MADRQRQTERKVKNWEQERCVDIPRNLILNNRRVCSKYFIYILKNGALMLDLTTELLTVFIFQNTTDDFYVKILFVCALVWSRGKLAFKILCKRFREGWQVQASINSWGALNFSLRYSSRSVLNVFHRIVQSFFIITSRCKGALPGRRQFLATESPLKILKNAFTST